MVRKMLIAITAVVASTGLAVPAGALGATPPPLAGEGLYANSTTNGLSVGGAPCTPATPLAVGIVSANGDAYAPNGDLNGTFTATATVAVSPTTGALTITS